MTNASTRSLPTDRGQMRAYLPSAPTDTTVTRTAEATARIKTAIRSVTAMLADLDRVDRNNATAIADAAMNDDLELTKALGATGPANRAVLEHHQEVLRRAWAIANQRHTAAEQNDPDQTAWRTRCAEITGEWEQAMSGEDDDARFAALVAFTERHNPR